MVEDTGIEPDPISQARRLAGVPYHQIGLSSINGASGEIRTPDLSITSTLLCQLSYTGLNGITGRTRTDVLRVAAARITDSATVMERVLGFEPRITRIKIWCLNQLGYTLSISGSEPQILPTLWFG